MFGCQRCSPRGGWGPFTKGAHLSALRGAHLWATARRHDLERAPPAVSRAPRPAKADRPEPGGGVQESSGGRRGRRPRPPSLGQSQLTARPPLDGRGDRPGTGAGSLPQMLFRSWQEVAQLEGDLDVSLVRKRSWDPADPGRPLISGRTCQIDGLLAPGGPSSVARYWGTWQQLLGATDANFAGSFGAFRPVKGSATGASLATSPPNAWARSRSSTTRSPRRRSARALERPG